MEAPTPAPAPPPPPVCPECGTPTTARRLPTPVHWTDWRTLIPRLAPLLALAAAAVILAWPSEPNWPPRPMVPATSPIGLAKPVRAADLGSPPPGDAIVRQIAAGAASATVYYGPGQLQVGIGTGGTQFWASRVRGWPLQSVHRHYFGTEADDSARFDFDTANPAAATAWTAMQPEPFERAWSRGQSSTEQYTVSVAGLVLALVGADGLRRILRRTRARRVRGLPLLAAAVFFVACAAALIIPVEEQSGRYPGSGPVPAWTPIGLTDADLRSMIGRDDADAALLAKVAAAIGDPGDANIMLAIARPVTTTHRMRKYGAWEPLWYATSAVRSHTAPAEPFPAVPLQVRPSPEILFIELPARRGAEHLAGFGIFLGPFTQVVLGVYIVSVMTPSLVHVAAALIARRRAARGRCVACAYPLGGPAV